MKSNSIPETSGKLQFVDRFPFPLPDKSGRVWTMVWCLCSCGMGKLVRLDNYIHGRSTTCGHCSRVKHRMRNTPEYAAYHNARDRVFNKKCLRYDDYGGRGITFDSWWLGEDGFTHFIEDMGLRPGKEYSLGRIDNDGPYGWMWIPLEDGDEDRGVWVLNCRWETPQEQAQNRRPKGVGLLGSSPRRGDPPFYFFVC